MSSTNSWAVGGILSVDPFVSWSADSMVLIECVVAFFPSSLPLLVVANFLSVVLRVGVAMLTLVMVACWDRVHGWRLGSAPVLELGV